jgi:ribosomal protein S16
MVFFIIKLLPLASTKFSIFRIIVCKVLHSGKSVLVDRIGFYSMNYTGKVVSINIKNLGFWLNKGVVIKPSIFKLLRKFILKIF